LRGRSARFTRRQRPTRQQVLEITENVLMEQSAGALATLRRLKARRPEALGADCRGDVAERVSRAR
jgi:hypothetical protein